MESPYRQCCCGVLKFIGNGKDWGVVANEAVQAGSVVEVAPIVRLYEAITDQHLSLQRRVYDWGALGGTSGDTALALGYGSMYNHANPANLRYRAIHNGVASALEFVAARNIARGEELTVNYNDTKGDIASARDVWFEAHGVTPQP